MEASLFSDSQILKQNEAGDAYDDLCIKAGLAVIAENPVPQIGRNCVKYQACDW